MSDPVAVLDPFVRGIAAGAMAATSLGVWRGRVSPQARLTTTTHHDLHHAQAGWNYARWFTWWDRWLGTEHPEYLASYAAAVRRPLRAPEAGTPELLEA